MPYLINLLKDLPEDLGVPSANPAPYHLFRVIPEGEAIFLPEYQSQVFNHTVAQPLFLYTRSRRDIQTTVALLTTRVKNPEKDNCFKLWRCLKYLKGKIGLKLTLTVYYLSMVNWRMDESYAIHDDCKDHTGADMTLGKGAVTSFSRNQKIQGKSSTENELIGADDAVPQAIWTKYLFGDQGYTFEESIMYH